MCIFMCRTIFELWARRLNKMTIEVVLMVLKALLYKAHMLVQVSNMSNISQLRWPNLNSKLLSIYIYGKVDTAEYWIQFNF